MNWNQLIEDLKRAGMSQREIARHCGISAPRVTALTKGGTTVSYEIGDKLVSLWKVKVKHAA